MNLSLNRDAWLAALERIAEALPTAGAPVKLCLVGSAACLLEAMPGRASRDLDVWQPESDFDLLELKRAVEAAGLAFDPREALLPDRPYVQIITPGPAQTGRFEPVLWARMGRLQIYLPPWPNLIASKLARGDERDVEDVLFLAGKHSITAEAVGDCAAALPEPARQQVLENLVYLRILKP